MDALIFTNLAPEHIESHGSYEAYRDAKLMIAATLARSSKPKRFMIANADDREGKRFLEIPNVTPVSFAQHDAKMLTADDDHIIFTWRGQNITSSLPGLFNASNILAAAACADVLGIPLGAIVEGVSRTKQIDGRMERILGGQSFPVVIDYAHTPDSLEAVYQTFSAHTNICVLGNTGGGRDKWKRPVMGALAEKYCTHIILTDEDPYDEDPETILLEMKAGMNTKEPEIIIDRRQAIVHAITLARNTKNSAVLITGKGTDPFIMGPNGKKTPWDDRAVAKEVLQDFQKKT
jgi:UDP-N-acetylmuramoyl-L-alanyl-D-glutamate--2,6-diaminopimelate ligase